MDLCNSNFRLIQIFLMGFEIQIKWTTLYCVQTATIAFKSTNTSLIIRRSANTEYQSYNISLDIEVINEHQTFNLRSNIADKIYESNTHIVLLSVGPSTAVPMLCEAYKRAWD